MAERKTTEQFIEQAKQIHGDKYDYSKVEYNGAHTKVCIICPIHGEFWQTPHQHLKGHDCHHCAKIILLQKIEKQRFTIDQFIEKAKSIHGDKYDYSKVEYVNNKTKICIICPEHGEFWQIPSSHLRGNGCPKCSGRELKITEAFIQNAKQVHGDKYDYSKVEYKGNKTKVCIICPDHGEFWQTPNSHLNGKGCPSCSKTKKLTTEKFIEKAKQIHGDKYDYSKVEYKGNKVKVCIICPEHGEFWQKPNDHLNDKGCHKCNESKGEKAIERFLFENNIKFEAQKKFDTCKNKFPLPFDFYLPEQNLCIEFQGRQHFEIVEVFGGEEEFKKQQINDNIKREWCSKQENPNLLEITFNDDIDGILSALFKK